MSSSITAPYKNLCTQRAHRKWVGHGLTGNECNLESHDCMTNDDACATSSGSTSFLKEWPDFGKVHKYFTLYGLQLAILYFYLNLQQ